MKHWLAVTFISFLAPSIVLAQDSAYRALKTIGSQRGEGSLNQIVSIVGQAGHSEPVTWSILLVDPTARTGVREVQVTSGIITAERAPLRGSNPGTPIDLSKLNVDSEGAFKAAEQEAARNHVAFDSVNYQLTSRTGSGTPTWRLDLINVAGNLVGTVRIAADTGAMISGENWVPLGENRIVQERPDSTYGASPGGSSPPTGRAPQYGRPSSDYRDPAFQGPPPDPNPDEHSGETISSRANRYGASVVHFGETVADKTVRAARKVGGWFQKKISGQDTISEPSESRDDQYVPQQPPLDPYSQPVKPTQPE